MASLYDQHLHELPQPSKTSSSSSSSSSSSKTNTNNTNNSDTTATTTTTTTSSASANFLPISTPRRRLRDALKMEKVICEQLLQTGWLLVVRAGKKIDGRYGLVSAYAKFPDVRVTVYQTQTSQLQELYFKHGKDLSQMSTKERKKVVFEFINTLVFNGVNMLIPNPELDETHCKEEEEKVETQFQKLSIEGNNNNN
jgi:hypothetical protein